MNELLVFMTNTIYEIAKLTQLQTKVEIQLHQALQQIQQLENERNDWLVDKATRSGMS